MSGLYLAIEFNDETKKQLELKQNILKSLCDAKYEDPTRFHITTRFVAEDQININTALLAMEIFEKMYTPNKFDVLANGFRTFNNEKGGSKDVAWIGIDKSFPLYQIKYDIEECLNKCNFPLKEERFDGYTPHITMAYEFPVPNLNGINFGELINITIDNLSLWNGFKVNSEYVHNQLMSIKFK